jgi:membrane-associated phospholipid phosphatase
MNALRRWLLWLAATVAAVVACYNWLDRPAAFLANRLHVHQDQFAVLTHIPDPLILAAIVFFLGLGFARLSGWPLSRMATAALGCGISVIVGEAVKNQLKFVFGRTWPETWTHNNPSLIHDNVYGFHFFHGGAGYASFPSGHTTAICAFVSVLWIAYPKFRPLYAVAVAAVAIGLLGANYHFLSDVIAGGFLGVTIGWMTALLLNAAPPTASR